MAGGGGVTREEMGEEQKWRPGLGCQVARSGFDTTAWYWGLLSHECCAENRVGGRQDGSRRTNEGGVFQGVKCWLWQDVGRGM